MGGTVLSKGIAVRKVVIVAAVSMLALFAFGSSATAGAATKPNIVVIMADDQRQDDLPVMTKLKAALQDTGVTFQNSYVSYSLCCPSRTSFLTGQYMHNHDITWNFWPEGGYFKFKHQSTSYDPSTKKFGGWSNVLPKWLQNAGYYTGLVGKYLNQYGEKDPSTGLSGSGVANPREIPPGWSYWAGGVDPTTYSYYGYTLNVNGVLHRYGSCERVTFAGAATSDPLAGCKVTSQRGKDGTEYQTDVESTYAENFIKDHSGSGKPPFFLWVTPTAPHTTTPTGANEGLPAVPPNRYANTFATATMPRGRSFNEADVSDKPVLDFSSSVGLFSWFPLMNSGSVQTAINHYRGRHGAVKGLDDMVGKVVKALKDKGQLNNTIIIYTSDNGWLLGEHRIVAQKFFGFEESIRVPLVISGPGFTGGKTENGQAVNVDLAPTILRAAGVTSTPGATTGRPLDGIPLQTLMANPSDWSNRTWAVETGPNPRSAYYMGAHNRRYHIEVIIGGHGPTRYELYDLQTDPNELVNLAPRVVKDAFGNFTTVGGNPHYANVLQFMKDEATKLNGCQGSACQDNPASLPEPTP